MDRPLKIGVAKKQWDMRWKNDLVHTFRFWPLRDAQTKLSDALRAIAQILKVGRFAFHAHTSEATLATLEFRIKKIF